MSNSLLPADDREVRERALAVDRSFIVRAPAGSGKTRLLIQRFLALLNVAETPEEIVAITFTRKAAAEMRRRIVQALQSATNNATSTDALDETTAQLAHAVLARDQALGWQLLSQVGRLRIMTIDSLNASLTRQMPLAARFGAQPESTEDASALYLEAARWLVAEVDAAGELGDDIAALLTHLDNDRALAERLIADMLRARDQWLRNLPRMRERETLEATLALVGARALQRVQALFPESELAETLALASFAEQNMPEKPASTSVLSFEFLQSIPQSGRDALAAWCAMADFFLTTAGTWRKRGGINKKNGFPIGDNAEEKRVFASMKQRMGDLLERLSSARTGDALAKALIQLREAPPACYSDEQWKVLGAIVRLLPKATGLLWSVFAMHGKCDFTEIAQAANRALGEDDAPSDLALALDYRIRHLLVDEFQDTSFAQFELLAKLTRGWALDAGAQDPTGSTRRSLFLVGDPMQSIYRFREAEVGLFLRAMQHGIGEVSLTPMQLSVNFRSTAGVIEWVNRAFSGLMPTNALPSGQVPYSPSRAHGTATETSSECAIGDGVAVRWHPHFWDAKTATIDAVEDTTTSAGEQIEPKLSEARTVVAIIRECQRTCPKERIAILARNRSHLTDIIPALRDAGIVFRAIEIDPLHTRPVVQDLLALTRALLHPADRIAWLAVLRAPWCGLTLSDLALLTNGDAPVEQTLSIDPRHIELLLNDDARTGALSGDGRARVTTCFETLTKALPLCGRMPLRDLVESTWLALSGPACLTHSDELDEAWRLLDLLEAEATTQSGGSVVTDFAALLARVSRLYAVQGPGASTTDATNTTQIPAVEVLTIHKAKGLEWDTVIVPGLHRAPRNDDRRLLVWSEEFDAETGAHELLIAPIRESGALASDSDAIQRYVQERTREKQCQEDVRLLYVAATRAIRQLHLLASVGVNATDDATTFTAPRAASLLAAFWPAVEPALRTHFAAQGGMSSLDGVAAADAPKAVRASHESRCVPRRLNRAFTPPSLPVALATSQHATPRAPSAVVDFDWASESARHVGTVVHLYLQRIATEGLSHWPESRPAASREQIRRELTRLGVVSDALEESLTRVVSALEAALTDARGRWVLSPHRAAKSEWRLSGVMASVDAVPAVTHVAIDRTFIDESGARWIIDFKTGSHAGGELDAFLDNEVRRYRAQLDTYARLVSAMVPVGVDESLNSEKPPIRLGLYFPLHAAWREWEWREADPLAG